MQRIPRKAVVGGCCDLYLCTLDFEQLLCPDKHQERGHFFITWCSAMAGHKGYQPMNLRSRDVVLVYDA